MLLGNLQVNLNTQIYINKLRNGVIANKNEILLVWKFKKSGFLKIIFYVSFI